uniref:BTB domain-containing protein n=1 Tax=Setaria italica TaxID=4555 RepID=K3YM80_SETIT
MFSGNVDVNDLFASVTWPCQLPPGWTFEWDPSSIGEERVLEDDCIEVPLPSVGRSICTTIAAQAPMDIIFDIGGRVIRARRADVAALSHVMEALLYGNRVKSKLEIISIKDTNPAGFSLLIKYAYEGSLPEEADLRDTPINAWPMLLSLADMYCVERLKLHCASNMWDMACKKTVTTFLQWAIETNCTRLQEKCMSLIALISLDGTLTEDFVFVCYHHPEAIKRLRVLALKNVE